MTTTPQLTEQSCLNSNLAENFDNACTHCLDICPASAIEMSDDALHHLPMINTSTCTGCTACVSICPTDAMRHTDVRPAAFIRHAMQLKKQGIHSLTVTCSSAKENTQTDMVNNDIKLTLPCHATWTPVILASLAAEGIRNLHLAGTDQCDKCPMRYGAQIMQQTEKDYASLNHALGIRLKISHSIPDSKTTEVTTNKTEPERRAFFRNLIPSIAQGAAVASAQISRAAIQSSKTDDAKPQKQASLLPVHLQLFLRALPALQSNFTPVPIMTSLPLGAIQANDTCTACGECVDICPTDALYIKEFGRNKVLEFKPYSCIGCEQCTRICPEQALEILPSISLPAILTRKPRPLIMVKENKIYHKKES